MAEVKANMTGTILQVLVKPGDKITQDQDVFSIESMKMEMSIQSTVDGIVKDILVKPEDFVQEGQALLTTE